MKTPEQKERHRLAQKRYSSTPGGKKTLKEYTNESRSILLEAKAKYGCMNPSCPCAGVKLPTYCLDFHHVDPSAKSFNLGSCGAKKHSKVREEINKCIVLCAICHRMEKWGELDVSEIPRCSL